VSADVFAFGSFAEAEEVAASLSFFGLLSSAKVRFEIRKRADKNRIVARALNLITPPYFRCIGLPQPGAKAAIQDGGIFREVTCTRGF
jgi:hypothetical protein